MATGRPARNAAIGLLHGLRVLPGGGGGDAALRDLGVELLVGLQLDEAEEPLVLRLDQGEPGRAGRDRLRDQQRVHPALAVPGDQHPPGIGGRLGAEEGVGRVGLADERGQVDGRRMAGERAGAGLAAEVLVEPQGHDARPAEDPGDQLQGMRLEPGRGVVPVPVGGAAAGQQQGRRQALAAAVRRYLERAVGGGAVHRERDALVGRRDHPRRRRRRQSLRRRPGRAPITAAATAARTTRIPLSHGTCLEPIMRPFRNMVA